jgi:CAAX protease family protein
MPNAFRILPSELCGQRIADAWKQIKFLSEPVRRRVKSGFVSANSKTWQMNLATAIAIWAIIVIAAAFAGNRLGFSGPRFGIALGVAALLFAFELFLAAPQVLSSARALVGERGGALAVFVPVFAVLIYSLGVTRDWIYLLAGVAYAIVPALLLASSSARPPGTWQDYAAAIFIWLAVWPLPPFRLFNHVFSFPPPLTHTLSILMALSTGVAAYVVLRKMDGIGYAVEWRRGLLWNVTFNFAVFAAIAIPLGMKIGFLTYDPALIHSRSHWAAAIGILFFTAWPEEFLFRGILQNLFSRTFKNQWAGLAAASIVFGFSHILHAPRPNWHYVFLAMIAGFFYGRAWMKSGSLVPGTIVHFLVDTFWHVLFR